MSEVLDDAVEQIKAMLEDTTVPKNIREKLQHALAALGEKKDKSIKVDRALQELDEVGDDINLQSYARTQIWNIVSILEKC